MVEQVLDDKLDDPGLKGEVRVQIEFTRSQLEKTYLLRLLAEFEGVLDRIGPSLRVPVTFNTRDGLGTKLDQIGSNLGMDQLFRNEMDDKIRAHRNELFHGRSPVPRVSFQSSHLLMKTFLRDCW